MSVELNHTIVSAADKHETARFYTEVLGLPEHTTYGPFTVVELANNASLDFVDDAGPIVPRHYAFLVTEEEFDAILGRITERGLEYWADPGRTQPREFNRDDGGRGLYWEDPNGHFLEIITRPYGSGSN